MFGPVPHLKSQWQDGPIGRHRHRTGNYMRQRRMASPRCTRLLLCHRRPRRCEQLPNATWLDPRTAAFGQGTYTCFGVGNLAVRPCPSCAVRLSARAVSRGPAADGRYTTARRARISSAVYRGRRFDPVCAVDSGYRCEWLALFGRGRKGTCQAKAARAAAVWRPPAAAQY